MLVSDGDAELVEKLPWFRAVSIRVDILLELDAFGDGGVRDWFAWRPLHVDW